MANKVINKRSSVLGQLPSGDTLAHGEIAVNFNAEAPFLSIKDSENTYVKFSSDKAFIDADKVLDDKITELNTTVEKNELVIANALTDLDTRINGIIESSDAYIAADEAVLEQAKAYTDDVAKDIEEDYIAADNAVKSDYTAKFNALPETYAKKTDVYTKTNVYTKTETDTAIANADKVLDDKIAAIQALIDENEEITANALTDLDTRVNELSENSDAYVAADEVVLEQAKTYTDNAVKVVSDEYKAADNALTEDYTAKFNALPNTYAKKTDVYAKTDVYTKTETDTAISAAVAGETKLREDAIEALTNEIIDNELVVSTSLTDLDTRVKNIEENGANSDEVVTEAVSEAKAYTDQREVEIDKKWKAADATTLQSAKSYADGLAVNYDAKGAASQALADAKTYTNQRETAIETAYKNADTAIETAYKAADTALETAYKNADSALTEDYTAKFNALPNTYAKKTDVYTKTEADTAISAAVAGEAKLREDAIEALTNEIIDNELVVSTSLTDLDTRVISLEEASVNSIALTGDATGTATFTDNSASIAVTVADNSHKHTVSNISDFTDNVNNLINTKLAANDAMIFKGTIGASGTVTALPATHNAGWTYKVITAGTYAGNVCEVGDMIICITDGTASNNAHWTAVQTNADGIVTGPSSAAVDNFASFNATTGKLVKDSGYSAKSFATASHTHGTISLTGDATGNANFTNTGASITVTVADNSHYHHADNITGGTLNINRIPTGTTSTTVSRGDHNHSYITWADGMNTANTLTNVPITKRLCECTISANTSLTVTSGLSAGRELHILVYNSASSSITVTMPTASNYVNFGEDALVIPATSYAEINILSDGSKYFIRNGQ